METSTFDRNEKIHSNQRLARRLRLFILFSQHIYLQKSKCIQNNRIEFHHGVVSRRCKYQLLKHTTIPNRITSSKVKKSCRNDDILFCVDKTSIILHLQLACLQLPFLILSVLHASPVISFPFIFKNEEEEESSDDAPTKLEEFVKRDSEDSFDEFFGSRVWHSLTSVCQRRQQKNAAKRKFIDFPLTWHSHGGSCKSF